MSEQVLSAAAARPPGLPKKRWFNIMFSDVQTTLTSLCGLFLIISLIPGLRYVSFASALAGSYFAGKSAWDSIRARELDVNLLMVLAAIGAIAVDQVQDAAGLLFLFSLSSTLEAFAMAKTKAAIEGLIQLRPLTAVQCVGGVDRTVPVESLKTGDLVRVVAFAKVPLDGEVVEGESAVDESAITGESVPVSKAAGKMLTGGTQNLEGMLVMRVTKEVGNSTLDQIIAMVQEAQENKASGEKVSQWFGKRYTIFVLVAFFVSWVVRLGIGEQPADAFYRALILLVGLSPCALVISTPASTLSALAKAAREGILIRGGEYIEKAASIRVVLMDKTGTLTLGKPALLSVGWTSDPRSDAQQWKDGDSLPPALIPIFANVAAVEQYSTHPLAKAILTTATREKLALSPILNAKTLPGLGTSGEVGGAAWFVGNDHLLSQNAFSVPGALEELADHWKQGGLTTVWASDGADTAVFAFGDSLRHEAEAVIAELKSLGVQKVMMLTGDKKETALAMGARLNLTDIQAELLPADKTRIVKEMAAVGPVMMVGDGVNDAPSLAQATLGVAMGGLGSDVALEAADVVLMRDNLRSLPDLIRLGRRTQGVIRANLLFASGMIVTLAVSSFLFKLPLPVAVIGHEGSTVLVILNGLRLLK